MVDDDTQTKERDVREVYRHLFDRVADIYDSLGVDFFQPVANRLVALAGLRQGDRVLDIGCGRGAVLFAAAEAIGPGGAAIGVDLSGAMVRAANNESVHRGHRNVHAIEMDGQRPGFEPNSFDAVVGSMSIHMLADIHHAYANYRRILKERGQLAGCVLRTDETQEPSIFGLTSIARMAEAYTPGNPGSTHTGDFDTAENIRRALQDAGFLNVRIIDECVPLETHSAEQFLNWTWSHGMRLLWQRVPEADRSQWSAEIKSEVSRHRQLTGVINIPIPVRYFIAAPMKSPHQDPTNRRSAKEGL